ncbi:carboxypeptidase B-like [Trichomycterus rosablanca]|uniref:carboxypeptidase B-like n=1 Tax=Trichomycterus rosablanca TaxID=2290929 RepID=UPI002F35EDD8
MRMLLLLGLVAVALCEPVRYDGNQVFRLKPMSDEDVSFIKRLSETIKIDFWSPASADLVVVNSDVDIHVPASYTDMISLRLWQRGMQYKVIIKDLQSSVDAQTNTRAQVIAHSYTKYNRWSTIETWISSITLANPALVSSTVIGKTYEGRSMYLLKIGKNTGITKPAIFMDCGIHAREWISPVYCQWFVKEAVSTYGTNAQMTKLLDTMDVFVLPVFNVDGYEYSWKTDRMWRKTRSVRTGTRCIGADPNRNFNAGWCTLGASTNPCSDVYCGISAESEIEVKNVANFIRKNKSILKAYITIHSYSQLLLFPYSYKYDLALDNAELMSVAKGASEALQSLYGTPYNIGPGATTIYPASGGSDDWAYDLGVKYSYTFELRDTGLYGFLLPESQIQQTCKETMLAVKYIATYVLNKL